MTPTAC